MASFDSACCLASTEPCTGVHGKLQDLALPLFPAVSGFNGAVHRSARKGPAGGASGPRSDRLQRSRAPECTESGILRTGKIAASQCFNGAVHRSARKAKRFSLNYHRPHRFNGAVHRSARKGGAVRRMIPVVESLQRSRAPECTESRQPFARFFREEELQRSRAPKCTESSPAVSHRAILAE